MRQYIDVHGTGNRKALIDYAYSLSSRYGTAAGELACQMYDKTAAASGVLVPDAEPADIPEYGEVAKTVNGTLKQSPEGNLTPNAISRLVKRTGADTTLKNAGRDGAEFAWVPHGDTCAFCLTIASRGWQHISKKTLKNGHAEHIHGNCDCTYAIRFNSRDNVEGYDPETYLKMYDDADGKTSKEKINSLRREITHAKKQLLDNSRTDLLDEFVARSAGAKFQNYDILDLQTGEKYHLAEGTYLQNKEVFAGKGCKTEYRKAYVYADRYGGNIEDWQHVKGIGTLATPDGDRKAEIHWSQCEGIGKKDLNIKRWMD